VDEGDAASELDQLRRKVLADLEQPIASAARVSVLAVARGRAVDEAVRVPVRSAVRAAH